MAFIVIVSHYLLFHVSICLFVSAVNAERAKASNGFPQRSSLLVFFAYTCTIIFVMSQQDSREGNERASSRAKSGQRPEDPNGNNCHTFGKDGSFARRVLSVKMSGIYGYTNGSEKNY